MISNSSPLIFIAKLGILKELLELYKEIEISKEVYNEIINKKDKQDSILLNVLHKEGKIKIIPLNDKFSKTAKKIEKDYNLDKGESEIIALALQLDKKIVLIDESLGRNVAKLFSLKPQGTLRIILELYKNNIVSEEKLKSLVKDLLGKNFRVDAEVLSKFWELFEILKKK